MERADSGDFAREQIILWLLVLALVCCLDLLLLSLLTAPRPPPPSPRARPPPRATMSEKPKLDLGLLEEDDEFEEFPAENWGTDDADDEDVSVWEDNWEDDNIQDDFNQQLRQQLEKLKEQS